MGTDQQCGLSLKGAQFQGYRWETWTNTRARVGQDDGGLRWTLVESVGSDVREMSRRAGPHRGGGLRQLAQLVKDGARDGRDEEDLDHLEERELHEEGRLHRRLRDVALHAGEDGENDGQDDDEHDQRHGRHLREHLVEDGAGVGGADWRKGKVRLSESTREKLATTATGTVQSRQSAAVSAPEASAPSCAEAWDRPTLAQQTCWGRGAPTTHRPNGAAWWSACCAAEAERREWKVTKAPSRATGGGGGPAAAASEAGDCTGRPDMEASCFEYSCSRWAIVLVFSALSFARSSRKVSMESTLVPNRIRSECIGRLPVAVKTLTACSSFSSRSSLFFVSSSSSSILKAMLTSSTSSKSSLKKLQRALFERSS